MIFTSCMLSLCLVTQSCPTLSTPWTIAHQAPLSMGILQTRILEWVTLHKYLSFSELTFLNMLHSWYCSLPMQEQFIFHIFRPDFQYYSELSWSWEEGPSCSSRGQRDNPVLVNEMWEKSAEKNLGKFFSPDKREICKEKLLSYISPPSWPWAGLCEDVILGNATAISQPQGSRKHLKRCQTRTLTS